MNRLSRQRGITLVVSLIMLIVLTLLVVSAVRFGNINLKIAGNAQTEAEASAAVSVALEKTVELVVSTPNIANIAAQDNMVVSTGGNTYKVNVSKPICTFSKNVMSDTLDYTKKADQPCFEGLDEGEVIFDETGKKVPKPTACKDQNWDITASLTDNDKASGAKITMLQGVSVRVGVEVKCP
jgi:hypothetical protein